MIEGGIEVGDRVMVHEVRTDPWPGEIVEDGADGWFWVEDRHGVQGFYGPWEIRRVDPAKIVRDLEGTSEAGSPDGSGTG